MINNIFYNPLEYITSLWKGDEAQPSESESVAVTIREDDEFAVVSHETPKEKATRNILLNDTPQRHFFIPCTPDMAEQLCISLKEQVEGKQSVMLHEISSELTGTKIEKAYQNIIYTLDGTVDHIAPSLLLQRLQAHAIHKLIFICQVTQEMLDDPNICATECGNNEEITYSIFSKNLYEKFVPPGYERKFTSLPGSFQHQCIFVIATDKKIELIPEGPIHYVSSSPGNNPRNCQLLRPPSVEIIPASSLI